MKRSIFLLAAFVAVIAAWTFGQPIRPSSAQQTFPAPIRTALKVNTIVVIVQENRSFNSLFYQFPGTDALGPNGYVTISGTPANGNTVTITVNGHAVVSTVSGTPTLNVFAATVAANINADSTDNAIIVATVHYCVGGIPSTSCRIILNDKLSNGTAFAYSTTAVGLTSLAAGATFASLAFQHDGSQVSLAQIDLGGTCDLSHTYTAWTTEYNNGGMDGWDLQGGGGGCGGETITEYSVVKQSEIVPYWNAATHYTLAEHVLQSNEGPSFPAHQYLWTGQCWRFPITCTENGQNDAVNGGTGCNNTTSVAWLNIATQTFPATENQLFDSPMCFDTPTVADAIAPLGFSWHWYTNGNAATPGSEHPLWTAPLAIAHQYFNGGQTDSPYYESHVTREGVGNTAVLADIAAGKLANLVFITPDKNISDHPGADTSAGGPAYVQGIVNAIGASSYWGHVAIFLTWDDWGGFYDNYLPSPRNCDPNYSSDPYRCGFRVPLIAISPWTVTGIDATVHCQASLTHYIEDTFGFPGALPSLGVLDQQCDDLSSMFNYGQAPLTFTAI